MCVALGIQCEQCPLELVELCSGLCGAWPSVCHEQLPPVLARLPVFLFHALVLHLGCVPPGSGALSYMALSARPGNPGPSMECGLKQSLIDSTTTGPTGPPLCLLSRPRSPSCSGVHEPEVAF